MPMKEILKETRERMDKAVEHLRHELASIRTGKATTALLDGIRVEYYGNPTPLNQLATVSVLDAHTLSIQPWDRSSLEAIEKAILASELGLNPSNDGNLIRIPIPPLNEERRRELVKLTRRYGEDARIALRNIRRDAIEHLKKAEKEEHVSEDERKRAENQVQEIIEEHTKHIEELLSLKEKEIMEV